MITACWWKLRLPCELHENIGCFPVVGALAACPQDGAQLILEVDPRRCLNGSTREEWPRPNHLAGASILLRRSRLLGLLLQVSVLPQCLRQRQEDDLRVSGHGTCQQIKCVEDWGATAEEKFVEDAAAFGIQTDKFTVDHRVLDF